MHWLAVAKSLDFGRSTKIVCCGTDRTLSVSHSSRGFVAYCHRCQRTEFSAHGPLSIADLAARRNAETAIREVRIPHDFTLSLPEQAAAWFLKGGVPLALVRSYGFGWSAALGRVVLPVREAGKLTATIARSIDGTKPKYIAQMADKQAIFASDPATRLPSAIKAQASFWPALVVTEDILSAVRVGRIVRAVAILGTASSDERIAAILRVLERGEVCAGVQRIGIWTDPDKAGLRASWLLHRSLELQGYEVRRITSARDPKLHTDREIRELLSD